MPATNIGACSASRAIPMKKPHYDRITTTIEREWLAQIIAGTKKIEYRQIKPYWTKHFEKVSVPFELRLLNGMNPPVPEVTVLIHRITTDLELVIAGAWSLIFLVTQESSEVQHVATSDVLQDLVAETLVEVFERHIVRLVRLRLFALLNLRNVIVRRFVEHQDGRLFHFRRGTPTAAEFDLSPKPEFRRFT